MERLEQETKVLCGYADIETDSFMPSAITYARAIMDRVYQICKDNPNKLGVDIKTQGNNRLWNKREL